MEENNKHIKPYTAADIQRYLNRTMTAAEMHELEKAALEDPFLAEAIEGYSYQNHQDVSSAVGELKLRLVQKVGTKPSLVVKTKIVWSAAAAVLIVAGAALTWYWLTPSNDKIAQQRQSEQRIDPPQEITTADSVGNASDKPTTENTQQYQPENKEALAPVEQPPAAPVSEPATQASEAATDSREPVPATKAKVAYPPKASQGAVSASAGAPSSEPAFKENEIRKRIVRNPGAVPVAESQEQAASSEVRHLLTGIVTDNQHTALPFVNIFLPKEQKTTYADALGNFNLSVGDTSLIVEIKAAGFQPQKVTLSVNTPENHIILTPTDPIASKTAIAGSAARRAARTEETIAQNNNQNAEPADGWEKYETYLVNNIRLPKASAGGKRSVVHLSFMVDQQGQCSGFKILHSTCSACNPEAIRLVKEGPGWKQVGTHREAVPISLSITF